VEPAPFMPQRLLQSLIPHSIQRLVALTKFVVVHPGKFFCRLFGWFLLAHGSFSNCGRVFQCQSVFQRIHSMCGRRWIGVVGSRRC